MHPVSKINFSNKNCLFKSVLVLMSNQPFRVLTVDDKPDNLLLLQTILESEGFIVELASSGAQAIKKASSCSPDLILLDLMMPDMNGYEVIQFLRQDNQLSTIPIVLVTAHVHFDIHQGQRLGARDVVHKPIDIDELLNTIDRVLKTTASMPIESQFAY